MAFTAQRIVLSSVVLFGLAAAPCMVQAGDNELKAAQAETKLETTQIDSFSFKEQPLEDALAAIRKKTGLNIVVDSKHVDTKALTITIDLAGISAKNALDLVLKQKDLVRRFENGVVWITAKDIAAAQPALMSKTYDVRDITMVIQDFVAPEVNLRADGGKSNMPEPPDLNKKEATTMEDIIDTIKTTIEPDVWGANGHEVGETKGTLVVTTTSEIHKKIRKLLNNLRA